jgi:hypothetical protein
MSAQQYIRHQKNQYLLIGFLATLVAFVIVVVVAIQAAVTEQVAPRSATPPADPTKAASTNSCLVLMFDRIETGVTAEFIVEVDGSNYAPREDSQLGDLVAVVDGIAPNERFDIAITSFHKRQSIDSPRSERLDQRAAFNFVFDPTARYQLVTRRLVTDKTYRLDVERKDEQFYRRFLSRTDFQMTPECTPHQPGVAWRSNTSTP